MQFDLCRSKKSGVNLITYPNLPLSLHLCEPNIYFGFLLWQESCFNISFQSTQQEWSENLNILLVRKALWTNCFINDQVIQNRKLTSTYRVKTIYKLLFFHKGIGVKPGIKILNARKEQCKALHKFVTEAFFSNFGEQTMFVFKVK